MFMITIIIFNWLEYTNYSWLVKTQPNQLQAAIAAYASNRFPTRILFSKLSVYRFVIQ